MYASSLKVKECKNGKGVFTTTDIPANTPIVEIRSKVYSLETLPDLNNPHILQIGPNSYFASTGNFSDYLNHHCAPNCYLVIAGNRAILYSLYVIKAGSELTFDYSSTSTDELDMWQMNCNCGHFTCRRVISGFQYLDKTTQEKMKAKGMIPLYILEPQMFQNV
jgi:uncharacterized protein